MKAAILTIGPRGAGKTTFCRELSRLNATVKLVERDALLKKLPMSARMDWYERPALLHDEMWDEAAAALKSRHVILILDAWNPLAEDRRQMVSGLRFLGAEHIEGWYFGTPERVCVKWFFSREREAGNVAPDRAHTLMRSCRHEYQRYRNEPVSRDQGFDIIRQVNPLETSPLDFSFCLRDLPFAAR